MGLAESGKSTIINGVIKGEQISHDGKYNATINYQRINVKIAGKTFRILDLGGQTQFLDRFISDLSEFVFSDVDNLIFVVEPFQVSELSRSKYYLELSLERLQEYSPSASKCVLLHNIDLIPEKLRNDIINQIDDYLLAGIYEDIPFYITTMFSDSIYCVIGSILNENLELNSILCHTLDDFRKNNQFIIQIRVMTQAGAILLCSPDTVAERSEEITTYTLKQLHLLKEQQEEIILDDFQDQLVIMLETEHNLGIQVFISRDRLAQSDSIYTVHDRLLKLSSQISNNILMFLM